MDGISYLALLLGAPDVVVITLVSKREVSKREHEFLSHNDNEQYMSGCALKHIYP